MLPSLIIVRNVVFETMLDSISPAACVLVFSVSRLSSTRESSDIGTLSLPPLRRGISLLGTNQTFAAFSALCVLAVVGSDTAVSFSFPPNRS